MMQTSKKKVLMIGLDAPIAHRILELAQAGDLPAFQKIISSGVYAQHALVPFPTVTPPNWATIATGAWPSTHGITSFHTHLPGDPYLQELQSFDHSQCQSETIWEAAARAGKTSIVINFPTTHGLDIDGSIRLAGGSCSINSNNVGRISHGRALGLSSEQVFSTDEYLIDSTFIDFRPAEGWVNLPEGTEALEAELPLRYRNPGKPLQPKSWQLLLLKNQDSEYDQIILTEGEKDFSSSFATLSKGQWSETIIQSFAFIADNPQTAQGAFRCKLTKLTPDGRTVQLYVTSLCALEGWSYPENIAAQIPSDEGLPLGEYAHFGWGAGWIDTATMVEVFDLEFQWLANAAHHLGTHTPWDILSVVIHGPDTFHHLASNLIDPEFTPDKRELARYQEIERNFYQCVDRALEKISTLVDEDTIVTIISDHGTKATTRGCEPARILSDAGLTVYKQPLDKTASDVPDSKDAIIDRLWPFKAPEPDWSQTKAIPIGECFIYVNLKGRDPDGSVEPEEYEDVRDAIISALYDYTDPHTGTKPITLAVRREDARFFGMHGDHVGDIIYAIDPRFGRQHGPAWPTHEIGIGSLNGLFILAGPGVKQNLILERTVHLVDLVPTLCYLADFPVPKDAEGAILYQALQDPDEKRYELERLRENFKRLKAIYDAQSAESHTYNQ
jgi:predicted AlkP superfamily phosphohydrolase/phosphomutase